MTTSTPSELERRIRLLRKEKPILITSHAVLGYPSIEANLESIDALVSAGVEIIELQFPFSEPTADGPLLMQANLEAVKQGITPQECFAFASMITQRHPNTLFLIMTYYNVVFQYGTEQFVKAAADSGILGLIVPDLPPEESSQYQHLCARHQVSPIFLVTPLTGIERLKDIAAITKGMLYCVARQGVTGHHSLFSTEFDQYIKRIKSVTDLPLGVGFGVQTAEDVSHLTGKVDIAIVCSQIVKLSVEQSPKAAGNYAKRLRETH